MVMKGRVKRQPLPGWSEFVSSMELDILTLKTLAKSPMNVQGLALVIELRKRRLKLLEDILNNAKYGLSLVEPSESMERSE